MKHTSDETSQKVYSNIWGNCQVYNGHKDVTAWVPLNPSIQEQQDVNRGEIDSERKRVRFSSNTIQDCKQSGPCCNTSKTSRATIEDGWTNISPIFF